MATRKVKIDASIFDSVKPVWICPVTKREIDPEDTKTIDEHKAKVLAEIEAKAVKASITKQKLSLTKEFRKIATMAELKDWVIKRIHLDNPDMDLKNVKISLLRPTKNLNYVHTVLANILGLTAEDKKTVKKSLTLVTTGTCYDSVALKNKTLLSLVNEMPLNKSFITYLSKQSKKLTIEQKEALKKENPEYASKVKSLIGIAGQLHQLRENARQIENELEKVRLGTNVINFEC